MSNDLLILILQGLAGGAVVSVIVAGVRKLLPAIPRAFIPFLAVFVGAGAEYLTTLAGGDVSPLLMAMYGFGAVWLREIKSTVQEHGLDA